MLIRSFARTPPTIKEITFLTVQNTGTHKVYRVQANQKTNGVTHARMPNVVQLHNVVFIYENVVDFLRFVAAFIRRQGRMFQRIWNLFASFYMRKCI